MQILKNFYDKYKAPVWIFVSMIAIYFLYFHNLWGYHLMDIDETRYVDMSRVMRETGDYLTLYLNGEFFFEKPPLYFWLENLSFAIFNAVNEFTARIPGVVETVITSILLFFTTKICTKNSKLALIATVIFASSFEVIFLSKIAILDMLLGNTVTLAVLFGFMTFFVQDKNKKYFWWLFYLFSALALLAKGIPGIAVPFATMFFAGLYAKKLKEYFRPQYLLVGMFIFLAVSLPWHIIMFSKYGALFFNEYVMRHHVQRFLGAGNINRTRPFWFYIPVILVGIMPFLASFIAMLTEGIAKIKSFKCFAFKDLDNEKQFIVLSVIAALTTFLFFSVSGTKLVTYIIPIYPYLGVILAKYWLDYMENQTHKKGVEISSWIFNVIVITAGIGAAVYCTFFIQEPFRTNITPLIIPVLIATVLFPLLGIVAIVMNKRKMLFVSYFLFITFASAFVFNKALEFNYTFGQNDLMEYAKYAKENNLKIHTFETGVRFSLLYYSQSRVNYNIELSEFENVLKNPKNILIVRKSSLPVVPEGFKVVKDGVKYMIISL